jgi:hypothetical protein
MTGFYERGWCICLGRNRGSHLTWRAWSGSLLAEFPQRTLISRIASAALQWLTRAQA